MFDRAEDAEPTKTAYIRNKGKIKTSRKTQRERLSKTFVENK